MASLDPLKNKQQKKQNKKREKEEKEKEKKEKQKKNKEKKGRKDHQKREVGAWARRGGGGACSYPPVKLGPTKT